jgi:hypothetical protein
MQARPQQKQYLLASVMMAGCARSLALQLTVLKTVAFCGQAQREQLRALITGATCGA